MRLIAEKVPRTEEPDAIMQSQLDSPALAAAHCALNSTGWQWTEKYRFESVAADDPRQLRKHAVHENQRDEQNLNGPETRPVYVRPEIGIRRQNTRQFLPVLQALQIMDDERDDCVHQRLRPSGAKERDDVKDDEKEDRRRKGLDELVLDLACQGAHGAVLSKDIDPQRLWGCAN
jgi:hypothetical protein